MSANLIEFHPFQFLENSNSPARTTRSNSRSPAKKFKGRFQVLQGDKFFRQTQVNLKEASVLSEDPLISEYRRQLQDIIDNFDNKLLRVLHKKETKFLVAYKGVMREVTQDLKYYQKELEKNTEEYKESENGYLKQQMVIFKEEISKVITAAKAFEAENKRLRAYAINLKDDMKNQKEILLKSEMEKKALQEILVRLAENTQQNEKDVKNPSAKAVNIRSFTGLEREQTERGSNLLSNTPVRHFLDTDNTTRGKTEARLFSTDKDMKNSDEKGMSSSTKRTKSPNEMTGQPDIINFAKQGELKHLAELVSDILKEKLSAEEETKPLTEKIVNAMSLFVRHKTKEVRVLKETVERLQKTISQKEKMEQESPADPDGYRNENKILKEIFRECVEECTKTLIVNQHTLATARNFLDGDKQKELQRRVEIFEKYLSHPQVIYFLENIIADRPLDYQHPDATTRLKSSSVSQMSHKLNDRRKSKNLEIVNYQNRRAQEALKSEGKSPNDTSSNWGRNTVYYFGQPTLMSRVAKADDSASDLLSDKDQQVGPKMKVQTPTTATQDSRSIIGQSVGSLIQGRHTRSNSSSVIRNKISRGRLSKPPKRHDVSYTNIDDTQFVPQETSRMTPDDSTNLGKSPLSRRVQMTNGKAMFN